MKLITYLCFTLLSILIQFCLMDFINERIQNIDSRDESSVVGNDSYLLNNLKEKPHALFYRTERQIMQKDGTESEYSNSSLANTLFISSTDQTSTVFDLVFDDNNSMTDSISTTDSYFTSTDFVNVTEIAFFDKNTNVKSSKPPMKDTTKKCDCDLLYRHCDINCCCDSDCSEKENKLFKSCGDSKAECSRYDRNLQYLCSYRCSTEITSDIFHYLFCIDKINLPDDRKINENEVDTVDINKYLKWHSNQKDQPVDRFTKSLYVSGHPVWLLENGTLKIIEFPIAVTNYYCNGQESVKYFMNTHIKCIVKTTDVHMLYILRLLLDTKVVSPVEKTINSTGLNCTTLHCTNWTILVCDEVDCKIYSKVLHDPYCVDNRCYNIGVRVEYTFQCNESTIIKAIVKIYIKKVAMARQFISQEIEVNFYMGNDSVDDVIKYSGNSGYIKGLPVIASFVGTNHTYYFFNRTRYRRNYLALPYNENGGCLFTNMTHNFIKFGQNKRINCRLRLEPKFVTHNKTDGCLKIQAKILELLHLNHSVYISPYGNPRDMKDDKWISLERFNKSNIFGEYGTNKSKFVCHNLVTRFAFIFVFVTENIGNLEQNKILKGRLEGTARNVTFSIEDQSTMVTVDTSFIIARTPPNNLPNNLFLPLNSSSSFPYSSIILYLCVICVILNLNK